MAVVLKFKSDSPGVVVFTHKEVDLVKDPIRFSKRIRAELKKKSKDYLWGIHIGGYVARYQLLSEADFYLAPESTRFFFRAEKFGFFSKLSVPWIARTHMPLCARNFLTDYESLGARPYSERFFSLVSVARESELKRLPDFFSLVRKIYDAQKWSILPKILLICPEATEVGNEQGVVNLYNSLFSQWEQKSFSMMLLSKRMGQFPLPDEVIRFYLSQSQCFTLMSEFEGDSRIIHEAVLAGCNLLLPRYLKGGGLDYVGNGTASLFDTIQDAAEKFTFQVGARNKEFDATLLIDRYSRRRLHKELGKIFRKRGFELNLSECMFDDLSIRLPAHSRSYSEGHLGCADLTTESEFLGFLAALR